MKIRDFLHLDIDTDVVDNVCEELCVAFVGPIGLTEEGKKHFATALNLNIEVANTCDRAVVSVGAGSIGAWRDKISAAEELFNAAAGYCSEEQWNKWFKDHINVSIRFKDIQAIEKQGWTLRSIEEQDDNIIVEIANSSPLGEDVVEHIWLEDGDSMERAAYKLADSFDVDDHVSIWVERRGEDGVPDSIEDLVEDAKAIQKMICGLARVFGNTNDGDELDHEQPEIYAMVTISTAHITEKTADALHGITHRHPAYSKEAMAWPTVFEKGEYGYFLYISDDLYDREDTMPADLFACCCYAAAHECTWLVLDRDGPIMKNDLPTYEW